MFCHCRWFYVETHDVQLLDEYDQIYQDLEPFWGMDPKDLDQLVSDWEGHPDTFTPGKEDTGIVVVNYSRPDDDERPAAHLATAFHMMDILEDVQQHIPFFQYMTTPTCLLITNSKLWPLRLCLPANVWDTTQNDVLCSFDTYQFPCGLDIDLKKPPPVKIDGWIAACFPNFPA
jgi:hypothetical protein